VTSYEKYEQEPPRGWSPLAVALIATLVLLLGLGGAIFGIYAAGKGNRVVGPGTTQAQSFPTATASPTPGPTPTPTASPSPDGFPVPNVAGLDFQAARRQIRDLKLGVTLVFEGDAGDMTVRTTAPTAGANVRRGTTIKIFVKGPAPLALVPGVVGLGCAQAAAIIVDQGLFPDYETGRNGVVLEQSPRSDEPQNSHWNDKVKIQCGSASSSPAP